MSDTDSHHVEVDHERLIETTARLAKLLEGSTVVRIKASAGPYKWDIESIGPRLHEDHLGPVAPLREPVRALVAEPAEPAGIAVKAPVVGVFYRSPAPNEAPFVTEGQQVAEGDQLGIVEAMKMMNQVLAPRSGTVTGVHGDDGAIVEYGQLLFTVDPV